MELVAVDSINPSFGHEVDTGPDPPDAARRGPWPTARRVGLVVTWLVLVVAGMFMACAMERKAVDGAFTFGEAFMAALLAAATTTFLGLGMDVVLGSIIDPDLSEKMMAFTMQELEVSGVFSMVPEDQVEGMLADMQWAMKPAGQAFSWALGLLFWGIVSLIVGAIMKRADPAQF